MNICIYIYPRASRPRVFCCLSKVLTAGVAGDICRALVADCNAGASNAGASNVLPSVSYLAQCKKACQFDAYARKTVPLVQMVEPYKFKIPLDNNRGLGSVYRDQEMVLPHELFAALHGNYPDHFRKIFATEQLRDWWGHIPAEKRERHPSLAPATLAPATLATTVPLRFYGDDIAVAKTVHCLVLLFTSAAAFRLPAGEAYLPVSSTRLEGSDVRTTEEVYRVVRWSLEALCKGKWPATDHLGQPWAPGSERERLGAAGADLAGEFRAVIWEICGDWKWLAESIGFKQQRRYYLCRDICHKCGGRTSGRLSYRGLDYAAPCFSQLQSTASFLLAVDTELSKLPGFDIQDTALFDWMHVSALGIEPRANGSTLVELALGGRWGRFRGEFKVRLGIALKRAWGHFNDYCRNHGLSHRQPQFTPATLSMADGAQSRPELKAKARNCMLVTQWLASLTRHDAADAHSRNRSRVLYALASLNDTFLTAGHWLSDDEAASVDRCTRILCGAWTRLRAGARGTKYWGTIPKHHAAMHLLADAVATRRNPASYWCFSGEHIMGVSRRSLARQYQNGLDNRILRSSLVRLGLICKRSARVRSSAGSASGSAKRRRL